MAEALAYWLTLMLFTVVAVASGLMRHEMLILACIPPVFVALIVGFVMAIYAGDTFGWVPTGAAVAVGVTPGWWLARRLTPRDLLIAIYLAWAVALIAALIAFGFPDRT
jgi:ABC-type antimicrobial peptide transport system permease subunit